MIAVDIAGVVARIDVIALRSGTRITVPLSLALMLFLTPTAILSLMLTFVLIALIMLLLGTMGVSSAGVFNNSMFSDSGIGLLTASTGWSIEVVNANGDL